MEIFQQSFNIAISTFLIMQECS